MGGLLGVLFIALLAVCLWKRKNLVKRFKVDLVLSIALLAVCLWKRKNLIKRFKVGPVPSAEAVNCMSAWSTV